MIIIVHQCNGSVGVLITPFAVCYLIVICETVKAQLQEKFHLSKHYAKSTWGTKTRIAAKLTALSPAMMVNQFLGRPLLHLADLAV
jgi:hypothetical protein